MLRRRILAGVMAALMLQTSIAPNLTIAEETDWLQDDPAEVQIAEEYDFSQTVPEQSAVYTDFPDVSGEGGPDFDLVIDDSDDDSDDVSDEDDVLMEIMEPAETEEAAISMEDPFQDDVSEPEEPDIISDYTDTLVPGEAEEEMLPETEELSELTEDVQDAQITVNEMQDEQVASNGAAVYSGSCGKNGNNVTWRLDTDEGLLMFLGSGECEDYDSVYDAPWAGWLDSILSVSVSSGVTTIGDNAFENCVNLENVFLDSGVTTIGYGAFRNCQKLQYLNLPDSLRSIGGFAFAASGLKTLTIPSGVISLGAGTFSACHSLESVYINAPIERINNYTFSACQKLETVTLPAELRQIGVGAFRYCLALTGLTLPGQLEMIEDSAFKGDLALTQISIPDTTVILGTEVFASCTALSDMQLSSGLQAIPDKTFMYCAALTTIDLPEGLKTIGNSAFSGTGLTSVTLPNQINTVGALAFSSCQSLTDVTVKGDNTVFRTDAFSQCPSLQEVYGRLGTSSQTLAENLGIDFYGLNDSSNFFCSLEEYDFLYDGQMKLPRMAVTFLAGNKMMNLEAGYDFALYHQNCTLPGTGQAVMVGLNEYAGASVSVPFRIKISENSVSSGCLTNTVFWNVTDSNVLEITGEGEMPEFQNEDEVPWEDYTDVISEVIVGEGITRIGNRSFRFMDQMTSVTLPGSLTEIGDYAFEKSKGFQQITIPYGVEEIGEGAFYACESLQSIYVPSSVCSLGGHAFERCVSMESAVIDASIDRLEEVTFEFCEELTSVTLPDSITYIGDEAFLGCACLTELTLPANLTQIGSRVIAQTGISELVLPEELNTFGDYAFAECYQLREIDWPYRGLSAVIGERPFAYARSLRVCCYQTDMDLYIQEGDDVRFVRYNDSGNYHISWGTSSYTYTGEPIYPEVKITFDGSLLQEGVDYEVSYGENIGPGTGFINVQMMGRYSCFAFARRFMIEEPSWVEVHFMPDQNGTWSMDSDGILEIKNVQGEIPLEDGRIPWESFIPDIKEVRVIGGTNTGIGFELFREYPLLETVSLSGGVVSIGAGAFKGCTALKRITIPEEVTSIGREAFYGCSSMSEAVVDASITTLPDSIFSKCSQLTNVSFPVGLTQIGDCSFEKCTALSGLTIPSGVTSIGYCAFEGCTSLQTLELPAGLTALGVRAFQNSGLVSVDIPEGVGEIGGRTFEGCSFLKDVLFLNPAVSFAGSNEVFENCPALQTLYGYSQSGVSAEAAAYHVTFMALDDPASYSLQLAVQELSYNGYPQYPDARLWIGERELNPGTDYIRTYENNVNPGIATVTAYGQGRYAGISCAASFRIVTSGSIDSGTLGSGVFWYLTDDYTLVIHGKGAMPDWAENEHAPWWDYRYDIHAIRVENGITSVGAYAFDDVNYASSAVLAATVREIGEYAFRDINGLTEIQLPTGLERIGEYAFMAVNLTSVTVPKNVTWMGEGVFFNCSNLETVVLQAQITSLPRATFANSYSLTQVLLPDKLTEIGSIAFQSCHSLETITLPASLKEIGASAFVGCEGLQTIEIPAGVNRIDVGAFSYSGLTRVEVPAGVKLIGNLTFGSAQKLKEVVILNRTAQVVSSAFDNSTSLEKLYGYSTSGLQQAALENGIPFIAFDDMANYSLSLDKDQVDFDGSDTLIPTEMLVFDGKTLEQNKDYLVEYAGTDAVGTAEITVRGMGRYSDFYQELSYEVKQPENVLTSGKCGPSVTWTMKSDGTLVLSGKGNTYAYEDRISLPWKNHLSSIKKIEVKEGIVSLGRGVFQLCDHAVSVSLPQSLRTIGMFSMRDCTSLQTVKLPSNLISLGSSAFENCKALKTVNIPAGITFIAEKAFAGTGLTSITLPAPVGLVEAQAFAKCTSLKTVDMLNRNITITTGAEGAFSGCSALTRMYGYSTSDVSAAAAELKSANGKTVFVAYDKAASYKLALTLPTAGYYTYDGNAKKPAVKVTFDGTARTLASGTYTVAYSKNVNAGTASVVVTGKGKYTTSAAGVKLSATFKINPKSLKGTKLTLSGTSFVYTGKAIKPGVKKAVLGTKTLKNGTDFTVAYSKNINVGTATVTIKGKGNYLSTTSVSTSFAITKADPVLKVPATYARGVGTGAFKLAVTCKTTKLTYASSNKNVAPVNTYGKVTPKAIGVAVITVKAAATANYKAATKKVKITVNPKATTLVSLTSPSKSKISIKWTRNATGQGYQIYVSTSKTFSSGTRSKTINGNQITSIAPTGLTSGKIWYVKVRSWKKVNKTTYYGAWSTVKSVKAK